MLRVEYVGDSETFDPIMSLAGRRGGLTQAGLS